MHGALPQEEWPVSALRAVINEHLSRWLARCFGGLGKSPKSCFVWRPSHSQGGPAGYSGGEAADFRRDQEQCLPL